MHYRKLLVEDLKAGKRGTAKEKLLQAVAQNLKWGSELYKILLGYNWCDTCERDVTGGRGKKKTTHTHTHTRARDSQMPIQHHCPPNPDVQEKKVKYKKIFFLERQPSQRYHFFHCLQIYMWGTPMPKKNHANNSHYSNCSTTVKHHTQNMEYRPNFRMC